MATPGTFTPKPLVAPAQLGTAVGTLYTSPTTAGAQITSLILVNVTGTPTGAGLFLPITGGTTGGTNQFVKDFTVPGDGLPYDLVPLGNQIYMGTNSTIQGTAAAASSITYHISGVEFV